VDAAEIRADPYYERGGRVILEGKIETGDFDKLRSFVFEGERGVGLFAIYLASPGGDLAEAMKIGAWCEVKMGDRGPTSGLAVTFVEIAAARHGLKIPKPTICVQCMRFRVCCWN